MKPMQLSPYGIMLSTERFVLLSVPPNLCPYALTATVCITYTPRDSADVSCTPAAALLAPIPTKPNGAAHSGVCLLISLMREGLQCIRASEHRPLGSNL